MDRDELTKEQNYYVAKSNQLITRSRYSLTTRQHKLLLYLISKIKPEDTGAEVYTLAVKDIIAVCGYNTDGGYYYETIKQDIQAVANVSSWIETAPGKEKLFRWIDTAERDGDKAEFKITFHSTVIPYLFGLRRNYTLGHLLSMLCMSRKYSIRLYEYLLAMQYKALFEVSVDEVRKRIDAEKYMRWIHFKQKVLDPAMEEISSYTYLRVEYAPKKTGRKVTHIVFRYLEYDGAGYTVTRRMQEAKINPERRKAIRKIKKTIKENMDLMKKEEAIEAEGTVMAQMTIDELIQDLEAKAGKRQGGTV